MRPEGISSLQWSYLRHWLTLIAVTEALMLIFHQHLIYFYGVISLMFAGGFLLRVLKLYPGKGEPLILDASAVLLAGIYAVLASIVQDSLWRFALILTSSAIVIPHFIYIYSEK